MKNEKLYNRWKDEKTAVDVDANFADNVMHHIHQYQRSKRAPLFDLQGLIKTISAHPLAKAGLIAAGALGGIIRTGFMLYAALG